MNRPCPVCSGQHSHEWVRKEGFTVVSCSSCGMKYIQDTSVIAADYYKTDADKFYTSADKIRGDYAPLRYERELNTLAGYCSDGKILDVGCSTGGFLYQTSIRFKGKYNLFGTDVANSATAVAKDHGIKIIEANFLDENFPERNFQAITFWAVLEHLPSPSLFVSKAYELLAPGGYIFVVVPNASSLAIRAIGSRYRYIMAEHLNYFSIETLTRLVEAKFRPVRVTTSHFNPLVILQDFRRQNSPKPQERAELLNKTNAMKSMPVLKPLHACYKLCESLLARFGLADNVLGVFQKR
jgi:2-polyprenyl-3-methyl-5-hydroxy-6-metoxy-1,4-benzoquinol methylase